MTNTIACLPYIFWKKILQPIYQSISSISSIIGSDKLVAVANTLGTKISVRTQFSAGSANVTSYIQAIKNVDSRIIVLFAGTSDAITVLEEAK